MVASLPHNLTKEDMMTEDDFSLLLKYKLMRSTPDSLCQYADMSPELARRICNRLNEFMSFSQFAGLLKTKELTRTRINRALLHTLLEIPADLPSHAPGYVRLLGFQKKSSEFLRLLQNNSTIPVLTKAADYKKRLPKEEISAFETDIFVSNLYQSVLHIKKQTAFVHDLQKPPVLL
ncbi:MAG: nucleotidyltransferase family protein [Blautia hansenii]